MPGGCGAQPTLVWASPMQFLCALNTPCLLQKQGSWQCGSLENVPDGGGTASASWMLPRHPCLRCAYSRPGCDVPGKCPGRDVPGMCPGCDALRSVPPLPLPSPCPPCFRSPSLLFWASSAPPWSARQQTASSLQAPLRCRASRPPAAAPPPPTVARPATRVCGGGGREGGWVCGWW